MHIDENYNLLIKKIQDTGKRKENRTGVTTISTSGLSIQHNMADGFPLLTTKKMAWKAIRVELEFFIKGITDKKWLQDRNCTIWNEFSYVDGRMTNSTDRVRKEYQLKSRDLGVIYGAQWRDFNGPKLFNPPEPNIPYQPLHETNSTQYESKYNSEDKLVILKWDTELYTVQYLHCGTLDTLSKEDIEEGSFVSPYFPKVNRLGCIGYPKDADDKFYHAWERMIIEASRDLVIVSNDWLVFENFVNDLQDMEDFRECCVDTTGPFYIHPWLDPETLLYHYSSTNSVISTEPFEEPLEGFYDIAVIDTATSASFITSLKILHDANPDNLEEVLKRVNGKLGYRPDGVEFRRILKGSTEIPVITDQLASAINELKHNPNNRRILVNAWNPEQIHLMGLPPCHYGFQLLCNDGVLDLIWTQR